ncbi:MAG: hypothetical protein R3F05_05985 [Planctomycetota bacterium]
MRLAQMRVRPSQRSNARRRLLVALSKGGHPPPRGKPPSVLEVGVVFVGVCFLLVGGVVWIAAFVPTGCGDPPPSPTQRAVNHLEDVLYEQEGSRASRGDSWAELRADYELFLRRRNNRVNAGVEWMALRFYDHPKLADIPRGDSDGDATPAGQFQELLDAWGRPLVVMLPWERDVLIGMDPGAKPILFRRPPESQHPVLVFSAGPDGLLYTRDDVQGMNWWDLR